MELNACHWELAIVSAVFGGCGTVLENKWMQGRVVERLIVNLDPSRDVFLDTMLIRSLENHFAVCLMRKAKVILTCLHLRGSYSASALEWSRGVIIL